MNEKKLATQRSDDVNRTPTCPDIHLRTAQIRTNTQRHSVSWHNLTQICTILILKEKRVSTTAEDATVTEPFTSFYPLGGDSTNLHEKRTEISAQYDSETPVNLRNARNWVVIKNVKMTVFLTVFGLHLIVVQTNCKLFWTTDHEEAWICVRSSTELKWKAERGKDKKSMTSEIEHGLWISRSISGLAIGDALGIIRCK
uniref:Transmembrane protein n=1 Tax=Steinernema glaseri TaxID=37863 RepID=A0A1I8AAM2_9BILA